MKAERAVKRITFDRFEARSSETLYVSVPRLNDYKVPVPGSLALLINNNSEGGHANNLFIH